ncbi:MAG: CoA-binding protein [Flavobacteriaceae bacterium]|jgi:predicted CoA-binding protein|nr:CoA-binding protein [Flavobacteriaceae bacterium]
MKKTLILGASENTDRYSNKAIKLLRAHGYPVVAIGSRDGKIGDVSFSKEKEDFKDIDTVSLYLSPVRQKEYYEYILSLHPVRIIFNPGAENPEFKELVEKQGIRTEEACTLVLVNTNQF